MIRFNHEFLKQCREKYGWSVNEATYQLRKFGVKVSHPTLKSWEDGVTTPNGDEIGLLSCAYCQDVEKFYRKASKKEAQAVK